MEKNEIKKLYSMLDKVNIKLLHEYELEIKRDGINLYSINGDIYVLHSLIRKILKVNPYVSFYIDFKKQYLRII